MTHRQSIIGLHSIKRIFRKKPPKKIDSIKNNFFSLSGSDLTTGKILREVRASRISRAEKMMVSGEDYIYSNTDVSPSGRWYSWTSWTAISALSFWQLDPAVDQNAERISDQNAYFALAYDPRCGWS